MRLDSHTRNVSWAKHTPGFYTSRVLHAQDESSVLAGTSEGTVVQFQFISPKLDQPDKEWVRTRVLRSHRHDVRALVHTETAAVSGGQCVVDAACGRLRIIIIISDRSSALMNTTNRY